MVRFRPPANWGLRALAFLLAVLLWFFVVYVDSGRIGLFRKLGK
jgi:hypothetical protein